MVESLHLSVQTDHKVQRAVNKEGKRIISFIYKKGSLDSWDICCPQTHTCLY